MRKRNSAVADPGNPREGMVGDLLSGQLFLETAGSVNV